MTNSTVTMYTSGSNIPVSPTSTKTYNLISVTDNGGCTATLAGTPTVTVAADPTAPTLNVATPANGSTVCVGQDVSATANAGSGGTGGCTDEYQFSTNSGSSYSAYTPGTAIPTTGLAGQTVIIQARRICSGNGCDGAGETFATIASWTVVADPTAPTLNAATPANGSTVCVGQDVSATANAGSGGTGCTDEYQFSINSGSNYNSYTPGTAIPTTGLAGQTVIIQARRICSGDGCDGAAETFATIASWTVVADPTAPTLNVANPSSGSTVCAGHYLSATITAGTGGTGCTDEYQFSTNSGGSYSAYTPGTPISTGGLAGQTVIIQTRRVCTGDGCDGPGETFATIASWTVVADPTAPTLNVATPANGSTVCAGQDVSATITAGTGGTGCTDEYQFSINSGSNYNPYTPGDPISTTGLAGQTVIIQTRRICTGNECDGAGETFGTVASWSIVALPAAVTASGAGTFCGSTTITANNGGDGTIYFQGTTSGGTSTATPSTSEVVTSSGTYYFRARSAAGCWGPEGSVTVTINPLPTAGTCNMAGDLCQTNTGTIDIKASGGTPPYSVTWTPVHGMSQPQTITNSGDMITITGLQGGVTYTFVVKDANNCQAP